MAKFHYGVKWTSTQSTSEIICADYEVNLWDFLTFVTQNGPPNVYQSSNHKILYDNNFFLINLQPKNSEC